MDFLIAISIRSLALAGAAWSLLAIARVKSPAARHAVWTMVTVGTLGIAIAAAALPTVPVRVLRPLPPAPAVFVSPVMPVHLPTTHAPAPARPFPWTVVYAAGLLACLGRLAYGAILTRKLLCGATRLPQFEDPVYESAAISVPLTVSRRILLPVEWRAWSADKLAAVLIHEQAHVRRADWSISILAAVNRSVYWFYPLGWWLERHLHTLAEQACDDASLAEVPRESYAQVLVDMAAAVRATKHRAAWEAMAMAKGAEVRMRIQRILDDTQPLSRPLSSARWALLAICAVPAIFLAALARPAHIVRAQDPQAQTPAPSTEQQQTVDNADLQRARAAVEALQNEIRRFKADNQGKIPEQSQTKVSVLAGYQAALAAANEAVAHMHQQKLELETQLINDATQLAFWRGQTGEGSAKIQQLHERIRDAQSQLEALKQMYTDSAPQVKAMKAQIATFERELDDEIGNPAAFKMINDLEAAIALFQVQIQNLNRNTEQKLQEIQDFNRAIADYQQRIDEMPRLDTQYAELMHKWQQAMAEFERIRTQQLSPTEGPHLVSRRDPEYTPEAREARIQGKVELSVTVGADGVPSDIQVIHGLGAGLDERAIDCVKAWRFRPATHNGSPVPAVIFVEVPFRL